MQNLLGCLHRTGSEAWSLPGSEHGTVVALSVSGDLNRQELNPGDWNRKRVADVSFLSLTLFKADRRSTRTKYWIILCVIPLTVETEQSAVVEVFHHPFKLVAEGTPRLGRKTTETLNIHCSFGETVHMFSRWHRPLWLCQISNPLLSAALSHNLWTLLWTRCRSGHLFLSVSRTWGRPMRWAGDTGWREHHIQQNPHKLD